VSGPRPARRRAPTRWLLFGLVTVLLGLLAGVIWLEAAHPQLNPAGNEVPGVPPLALEDEPTCRRFVDETPIMDIRERLVSEAALERILDDFPSGGRVSATQVFLCPSAYDGMEVTYVGEVVGELLPRRGGAWAQVNDDDYALVTGPLVGHRERAGFNTGLSVWLEEPLADRITSPGRPALRGDVVLLRGTILRADPDDGGGITLRATELQTLAPPLEIDPPLHLLQVVVAGVLWVLALIATVWARQVRRR
jgi:hypothetical protein